MLHPTIITRAIIRLIAFMFDSIIYISVYLIIEYNIRKTICPQKIDTKTWVAIIKEAHKMGLPSTSTILYGHIEDAKSRILHMQILKEIQNLTKNFRRPYEPGKSKRSYT